MSKRPGAHKWTRRGFITAGVVAGGGLVVGVLLRPGHRTPKLAPLVAEGDEQLINAWVKIGADNHVTAIVPHAEMGQGAQTALAQMLADELDADWSTVSFMEAPAHEEYANYHLGRGFLLGDADVPKVLLPSLNGAFLQLSKVMGLQITGGSLSVRATGVHGMRVAGAAAREMLIAAAAAEWQVDASTIQAASGQLSHSASGHTAAYGQFAAAAGAMTPPAKPQLKTPEQFNIMGRSPPRHDIPAKVDGSATFGIDVEVPGMKYAAIKAAPVFGATVADLDSEGAMEMPGVIEVISLNDAVAVVADGYWQASQALDRVTVTWSKTGNETVTSATIYEQFDRDMARALDNGDEQSDLKMGNARSVLASADRVVEATYRVPYLAHACMEPMNATASVTASGCEVWTGSQNPLGFRASVAKAIGLEPARVWIHNHYLGGGFGRRSTDDYAVQAARLSHAAGVPVKLIWSREEDTQHDHYRPAITSKFRAALNDAGEPIAWENQFVDKHEPSEAPHIPYAIDNQFIHYADSPTHVPFGPWRSVDHSQHGFFTESFVDELAHAAGRDPFEYRRDLLTGAPRHKAVLELAAEKADWGNSVGVGKGRGIALQSSFGTLVAQVVNLTVRGGEVRVDRVVCAVDPGFAVSPDGLTAQMESGIIYGLTAALFGEIYIDGGRVVQSNFHDYPMVRMDTAPEIETHIINSGASWGGAGEPGTPAIAPALANAIFDATGTRIRELPISKFSLDYRIVEPEEVI